MGEKVALSLPLLFGTLRGQTGISPKHERWKMFSRLEVPQNSRESALSLSKKELFVGLHIDKYISLCYLLSTEHVYYCVC